MRLLASTDFALRVLIRLAAEPDGRHLSVEALAHELGGLSRNHLHKVVQELAALGMVRTVRGARGGVALARPPGEIRLGELVQLLEAGQSLVECFRADGGACVLTPRCRLKGMLGAAWGAFLRELDRSTLAECLAAAPLPPALARLAAPAPRGPGRRRCPQAPHSDAPPLMRGRDLGGHLDIDLKGGNGIAAIEFDLNHVAFNLHMAGDDRQDLLLKQPYQVAGGAIHRPLMRQDDLQTFTGDRRRGTAGKKIEQFHATLRLNRRCTRPRLSSGTFTGTVSPRSRRAASK